MKIHFSGSSDSEYLCFCLQRSPVRFPDRKILRSPNGELQHDLYEHEVLVVVVEDDRPTVEGLTPRSFANLLFSFV